MRVWTESESMGTECEYGQRVRVWTESESMGRECEYGAVNKRLLFLGLIRGGDTDTKIVYAFTKTAVASWTINTSNHCIGLT